MKTIITLILIMTFSFGYCQEAPKINKCKPKAFAQVTPQQKFENDLKRNSFTIYTIGGLKPSNHKIDKEFQKKFSIIYHDFGCIAPPDMDYYTAYNFIVFKHLSEKWGNVWEKDIKDNAMGF